MMDAGDIVEFVGETVVDIVLDPPSKQGRRPVWKRVLYAFTGLAVIFGILALVVIMVS
jgi:hypothetical protein